MIEFTVYDIPRPGGSKRAFYNQRTGRAMIVDACKKNKPWREAVKAAAIEAYQGDPLTGPLGLSIVFYMPRPKGHFRTGKHADELKDSAPAFPTTMPDATKLARSTEDALTGLLWRDDAQIVSQWVRKRYAASRPGAEIKIIEWIVACDMLMEIEQDRMGDQP